MMGRNKEKYRIRRNVYVSWEVLESAAFQRLSATGIRVFLRFLQKRTWGKVKIPGKGSFKKIVFNTGGLSFTYSEATALGISISQFHSVMKRLIELGFIDVEHQGGGLGRDYSRYELSERWRNYGTDAFKTVEKKRVLWTGHDVRSRMMKKNKATENRNYQLQKSVVVDGIDAQEGIRNL